MKRRQLMQLALLSGGFGLAFSSCRSTDREEKEISFDLTGKTAWVVGAGVSGLSAARKLKEYGADVKVLEAQNRVGAYGRIDRWGVLLKLGLHGFTAPMAIPSLRWQMRLLRPLL